jgi:hypothetical protein
MDRQPTEDSITALLEMTGLDPVHERQIVSAALRNAMRQAPLAGQDTIVTMALDEFFQDPQKVCARGFYEGTLSGASRGASLQGASQERREDGLYGALPCGHPSRTSCPQKNTAD